MACCAFLRKWRRLLIILLAPLLLLPIPLIINTKEGRTAFVLFLMATYWVTEAVPIAMTAMVPMFLFPLMSVSPPKTVANSYIRDLLMLFLGGLLMAVAIEKWNLHRRIALRILLLVGSEPRWLMLGLMLATWFLSMWMSNTATTAMMVPITSAILEQLKGTLKDNASVEMGDMNGTVEKQREGEGENDKEAPHGDPTTTTTATPQDGPTSPEEIAADKQYRWMCKGMLLAICYGANCGGIATLTGTGPNLALKNYVDELYNKHDLDSPVNFATWMGFGLLLSALVLVVCWIWLQVFFLRCRGLTQCCTKSAERDTQGRRVKVIIQREYGKLGPVSFAERAVMMFFGLLVILWITRDLGGVGGWGSLFAKKMVSDSTPAVLIGFCFFFFPSSNPFQRQPRPEDQYGMNSPDMDIVEDDAKPKTLLTWNDAHSKIPWALFLLLGGGFALSDGCESSGLSYWMGEQLEVFSGIDSVAMLLILCYITAAMTEVTSNTAISILLLPILRDLALRTLVHPMYYMIPATLACSFAFMLPVATPPNAIVFATGHIRVTDMMAAGVVMNLVAVPLLVMATITWGDAIFDFDNVPPEFFNITTTTAPTA